MTQFDFLATAPSYANLQAAIATRDAAVGVVAKRDKSILVGKEVCTCLTELNMPLGVWAMYNNA